MSQEAENVVPNLKPKTTQPIPDTVFKEVMEEQAQLVGLQSVATELQIRQSTRSDLVFKVPPGLALNDTLFDFFRQINVIEFKSENDTFNEREFYKNVMRVYAIYIQDTELNLSDLLNVIVIASTPAKFFKTMEQNGQLFEPVAGQSWQRQGQFGNQTVIFIICDQLPLAEKYYPWLLFAPAKEQLWHDFLLELLRTGANDRLLEAANDMRPKEFAMTVEDFERLLVSGEIDPQELEQWDQDRDEAIIRLLQMAKRRHSRKLGEVLQVLTPEERLSGLKPEERLSGLKPEERLTGMSEAEREQLFKELEKQFKKPE